MSRQPEIAALAAIRDFLDIPRATSYDDLEAQADLSRTRCAALVGVLSTGGRSAETIPGTLARLAEHYPVTYQAEIELAQLAGEVAAQ